MLEHDSFISKPMVSEQISELLLAMSGTGFIAGSAAYQAITGENSYSDIDIFSRTLDSDLSKFLPSDYRLKLLDIPNATEWESNLHVSPVQLINPKDHEYRVLYGEPMNVLLNFAFDIEQFAIWRSATRYHTLYPANWKAMGKGYEIQAVKRQAKDTPHIIWRAFKHVKKGYSISRQTLANLIEDLSPDFGDALPVFTSGSYSE